MSNGLPFPLLGDDGFDVTRAGKKAAPLHELARVGAPVPPGFVVDPSMRGRLDAEGPDGSLWRSLLDAVERVGGFPVAVRSSSDLEDLPSASFAGLYDTFLDVNSPAELRERIGRCFRSGSSDRVRAYLAKRGLGGTEQPVSVLVQKMVDSRAAGVFFTLHPLSGKEEEGLIEACAGLGERLVSSQVTPSSYTVDLFGGQIVEERLSDEGALLSRDEIGALVRRGVEIQARFGAPQDIEWAIAKTGELFVLQSRPITKVQWRKDVDDFTNADFRDGGVSARVCTPLMFSFYEDAMQASMQRYFTAIRLLERDAPQKSWIRSFYGRAYWNASEVKRRLFRIPGFDERAFDADLGIQKEYGERGPVKVPSSLRLVFGAIPVAVALEREYAAQLRRTEHYGAPFLARERALDERLGALEGAPLAAIAAIVREVFALQGQTEIDYFTTIYNNSNLQGDFKKLLESVEKKTGYRPSIVRLLSGLDGIGHLKIQTGLLALVRAARRNPIGSSAWLEARAAFLRECSFHADAELDLTCPRWGDRPERIDEIVGELLREPEVLRDPALTTEGQAREFASEKAAVLEALDRKPAARLLLRRKFVRELARTRTYLKRREEMREYSTRAYHLARRAALLFSRRLVERGVFADEHDLFFLRTAEVLQLCGLGADFEKISEVRAVIARRRQHYDGYRNLTPPNELGGGVAQAGERGVEGESADGKRTLRGLGCSPGRYAGRVRVAQTLDEAYRLEAGEILVTRFTDPGWTPILGRVPGVITEVGGMLSHAAVIGREYGIPAILNLPGATTTLRTGQAVMMDGETGEIVIEP